MRLVLGFLLVTTAPLAAAPLMIAPERVLAALAGNEYAQLNLNRDAYQDLAVLTVSENKTAVEFYLSISDPDTGELQVASFNPAFLPYHSDRVTDVYYEMYFEMEWTFGVSVTSVETGLTLHISFFSPEGGPISIAQMSTFRASTETSASVEICRIVYDVFEGQWDGGKAFIHLPDGETVEYDSGSPPAMTDWRYTDLPAVCIP